MARKRKVKIQSVLESQIPSFLREDSPLFKEFLQEYYRSQEHNTGTIDLATNITDFKNIETYTNTTFHTEKTSCLLTEDILSFDDEIRVNSTVGFPEKYGLIKIDDEIITYSGITTNSFIGCSRGFSGVSEIKEGVDSTSLVFSSTESKEHLANAEVVNLNLVFYKKLFDKFKAQYLPDFEGRDFSDTISLELILSRAKDFYLTKGTDISFKILFELLYADNISVIKPRDFLIRTSPSNYLSTKNILVERISSNFNPFDLIGYTLYQKLPNGNTASASIYNVEYRPTDDLELFEISLDTESFIYDFQSTKKANVIDIFDTTVVVDSTIGFGKSGKVLIFNNNVENGYVVDEYDEKTVNEFIGFSSITTSGLKRNDFILENNLPYCILDSGEIIEFRLINVIGEFDYSFTNNINVNDTIKLSSFGEDLTDDIKFNTWLYNYSTYHNIKSISPQGNNTRIELFDSSKFYIGDVVYVSGATSFQTTLVNEIVDDKTFIVDGINIPDGNCRVTRKVAKSSLNSSFISGIQNTYLNLNHNSTIVASSGLPSYQNLENVLDDQWKFELTKVGTYTTSILTTNKEHNFYTGNRLYLNSNEVGITTGEYFVEKINSTQIKLYYSQSDIYTQNKNLPLQFTQTNVGTCTPSGYENLYKGATTQKILKEFIPYTNFA